MVIYENDCCGCDSALYPCIGNACKLKHNPHYYCDECGDEFYPNELYKYDFDEEELCSSCLLSKFKTVE